MQAHVDIAACGVAAHSRDREVVVAADRITLGNQVRRDRKSGALDPDRRAPTAIVAPDQNVDKVTFAFASMQQAAFGSNARGAPAARSTGAAKRSARVFATRAV
jgi:hypothetical protein